MLKEILGGHTGLMPESPQAGKKLYRNQLFKETVKWSQFVNQKKKKKVPTNESSFYLMMSEGVQGLLQRYTNEDNVPEVADFFLF